MGIFSYFANPNHFMKLSRILFPILLGATAIFLGMGVYLGLFNSPADYQQGETVRIMYIHVPAAWMALFVYTSMAVASLAGLIWRHLLADLYSRAVAVIGAGFTAICLITGAIWGEPTWGTWWVWDARLTSVLVLFFLYIGYIAIINAFDDEQRGLNAGAILILIGFVNIPIIKFSVEWWSTLHQPASLTSINKLAQPAIHPDMLKPLIFMALGYMCLFGTLAIMRLWREINMRKCFKLSQLQAEKAEK